MHPFNSDFIEELRFNEKGLIPAIAQDWLDGAILMMAWMNKKSLKQTLSTGQVHYWSRSRNKLWKKGETSGNTQTLKTIRYDCDSDALLLTIEQKGSVACHTGRRSCFYQEVREDTKDNSISVQPPTDACSELFNVIEDRRKNPEEGSYTNKLFERGENQILKKIGEESAEFVMACKENDFIEIANEAADLIFHLQVALADHNVKWKDVLKVLAKRRGAARRET